MTYAKTLTLVLSGIATAGILAGANTAPAAEYYAGKTINFIVGFNPGGGTDATHRTYSPFIGNHIPGNPKIVVKNMSGAGGMKATNFVYEKAKPDGLTLLTNPWDPIAALIKSKGLRADYTKFNFIGGGAEARVTMVRSGAMPDGKNDRAVLTKATNLKLAGNRPTSSLDMVGRLSLDLLGVSYKYVPGYRGAAQRRAAQLSGEADVQTTGILDYYANMENNHVKTGMLFAAYYHPRVVDGAVVTDPTVRNIPDFASYYRKATGKNPSGSKWELLKSVYTLTSGLSQSIFAPPGTPPEAVKALRIGYAKLLNDPDFAAFATKRFGGPLAFLPTKDGQAIIDALANTNQETVAALKAFIAEAKM